MRFPFFKLTVIITAALLTACAALSPTKTGSLNTAGQAPEAGCKLLTGMMIPAAQIGADAGLKSGNAVIDSSTWVLSTPLSLAPNGPTPEARINPATPEHCKVLGHIKPVDPAAPNIHFQVNLPKDWNGKSLQHGGGGFNGVLVNGYSFVRAAPFNKPAPLAEGYATVGTDSGHQNKAGEALQAFAANDEAMVNFAHASYKKVRDVSVALMQAAYGQAPSKLYFSGSSEGGREALTMAQRYPRDFNGIIARVPVINWTGLMHIGLVNGIPAMKDGWINAAQTKLVHDAVLVACDALDGANDGIVSDVVACRAKFDVTTLQCKAGQASASNSCLNNAQIKAIKTLHTPLQYPFPLANGIAQYPARGPGAESLPSSGPMGGWTAWWMGSAPLSLPTRTDTRSWDYSVGAIKHIFMQKPNASNDEVLNFKLENYRARAEYISSLMDSTNPDLSAFQSAGGKLILMEYLGDYAQSPFAGIEYFESVQRKMGASNVAGFAKLYAVPSVDHVGTGAPSMADVFTALADWTERGAAPKDLTLIEHASTIPFAPLRTRPLCEWPLITRYKGGDMNLASSFECKK